MVTLQNIADKVGMSRATVCLALNKGAKNTRLSKATCEKIINIAKELNYRPNALASAIKTGKTNVVGVLGGLHGSYAMDIINGIADVATQKKYLLKVLPVEQNTDINELIHLCIGQCLDGVICRLGSTEDVKLIYRGLQVHNIPLVVVDNIVKLDSCSQIYSDDYSGTQKAIEYLWGAGHRNIVNVVTAQPNAARTKGYTDAMLKLGGKPHKIIVPKSMEILHDFIEIIDQALSEVKPSAFFCDTDPIAMQVLSAASTLGRKIPEHLSVIGFGGLDYTAFSSPTLTTLRQPFREMGRKAMQVLLSKINQTSTQKETKLPVELIIRNSSKLLK